MEGLLLLYVACYFLPWIIAAARRHRNTSAIFILNLFLGWTFLGWVVALVWAATNNVAPAPVGGAPAITLPERLGIRLTDRGRNAVKFLIVGGFLLIAGTVMVMATKEGMHKPPPATMHDTWRLPAPK